MNGALQQEVVYASTLSHDAAHGLWTPYIKSWGGVMPPNLVSGLANYAGLF